MANKKISELQSGGEAQAGDRIPIARSARTLQITVDSITSIAADHADDAANAAEVAAEAHADAAAAAALVSAKAYADGVGGSNLGAMLLEDATQTPEFDSVILRKTLVADGSYNFPPCLVRLGSTLRLLYYKGTNHTAHTNLAYIESADNGLTWGSETVLPDWLNQAFGLYQHVMPNGNISSTIDQSAANPKFNYSTDQGATWSAPAVGAQSNFVSVGFVLDGYLYLASFKNSGVGAGTGAFLFKSQDGITWTQVSEIRKAGEPALTETGICRLSDGRFLAVSRDNAGTNTYAHFSSDQGVTWGDVIDITSVVGLLNLPQLMNVGGLLVLLGRDANAFQLVMYLSYDEGATWSDKIVLDVYTTAAIDGGYCSPLVINATTLLVAYSASATYAGKPDMKLLTLKFRGGAIS